MSRRNCAVVVGSPWTACRNEPNLNVVHNVFVSFENVSRELRIYGVFAATSLLSRAVYSPVNKIRIALLPTSLWPTLHFPSRVRLNYHRTITSPLHPPQQPRDVSRIFFDCPKPSPGRAHHINSLFNLTNISFDTKHVFFSRPHHSSFRTFYPFFFFWPLGLSSNNGLFKKFSNYRS